jgi:hypothetical protein
MFGASSGQITTTLKARSLHGSIYKGMIKNIILQMYTYVDNYTNSSFNVATIQFAIPQLCLIKIFHHTNPTSFKCKLI